MAVVVVIAGVARVTQQILEVGQLGPPWSSKAIARFEPLHSVVSSPRSPPASGRACPQLRSRPEILSSTTWIACHWCGAACRVIFAGPTPSTEPSQPDVPRELRLRSMMNHESSLRHVITNKTWHYETFHLGIVRAIGCDGPRANPRKPNRSLGPDALLAAAVVGEAPVFGQDLADGGARLGGSQLCRHGAKDAGVFLVQLQNRWRQRFVAHDGVRCLSVLLPHHVSIGVEAVSHAHAPTDTDRDRQRERHTETDRNR